MQPEELYVLFPDGRIGQVDGVELNRFSFSQFPANDTTLEIVYNDDSRDTVDVLRI